MSVADRSWMYNGWNDNGCHSQDWVHNTNAFLDHAFSAIPNAENRGVVCTCSDCCNRVRRRRAVMSMHLCKRGYMLRILDGLDIKEHLVTEPPGILDGIDIKSILLVSLHWNMNMITKLLMV